MRGYFFRNVVGARIARPRFVRNLFNYREKCKVLESCRYPEAETQRSPSFSSACAPSSSAPITPELTPSAGGTI